MELLNQNMPKTYFELPPEDLMYGAGFVRARPFYGVPTSPGSVAAVESEYAFPCFILDTLGDDMIKVRFDWGSAPGRNEQAFYPHEIHLGECMCRPCIGDNVAYYATAAA